MNKNISSPHEEAALVAISTDLAYRLDSWLSALRHGRVVPRAYAQMTDYDRTELDALVTALRIVTKAVDAQPKDQP